MSFPRYPTYKRSGVEWLGEVPEHWQEKPLKTITSINDEVLPESLSRDYEIEYVDIGSVSLANGIEKTEAMLFGDAPSRARRIPRDGDVLVSTVRTYLKAIAPVVNPPSNLVASTGFAVVRPRHELEPGFLKYALQEEHFIQQVISRSTGVSYPAINASDVAKISLNLPGSSEQLAIATFLNHETAKIDALIAEQQRLIELLQEKRQAVISHAVTKGLNPHAPMKDSRVEWLGEVPEHWEVTQLRHYSKSIPGFAFPSAQFVEDESQWKLLRGINVGVSCIRWDEVVYWEREDGDQLDQYVLAPGDLVVGLDRPLIKEGLRVARVRPADCPCLLLQRVAAVKGRQCPFAWCKTFGPNALIRG
jgi:type I restriction enzyme S subunit